MGTNSNPEKSPVMRVCEICLRARAENGVKQAFSLSVHMEFAVVFVVNNGKSSWGQQNDREVVFHLHQSCLLSNILTEYGNQTWFLHQLHVILFFSRSPMFLLWSACRLGIMVKVLFSEFPRVVFT